MNPRPSASPSRRSGRRPPACACRPRPASPRCASAGSPGPRNTCCPSARTLRLDPEQQGTHAYLRDSPVRLALCYPAHGFGSLWERSDAPTNDALARLVGHTRARLLCELERPSTVTEPATGLGVTVGAVSQHPGVLRAAGLAVGRREGREVVSPRTGLGPALVRGEVP
ncbi:ArsR/SmtB family transcription factor [Saccharothrix saharensis]|uniref:ArsR/SmtB family transcription factor n=1 Tax=Saccharothrix saharensis TaxID=571190 RepID=UPI0036AE1530